MLCFSHLFVTITLASVAFIQASPLPLQDNAGDCNGILSCNENIGNNIGNNVLSGNHVLNNVNSQLGLEGTAGILKDVDVTNIDDKSQHIQAAPPSSEYPTV